jgi:hypothetical protein
MVRPSGRRDEMRIGHFRNLTADAGTGWIHEGREFVKSMSSISKQYPGVGAPSRQGATPVIGDLRALQGKSCDGGWSYLFQSCCSPFWCN